MRTVSSVDFVSNGSTGPAESSASVMDTSNKENAPSPSLRAGSYQASNGRTSFRTSGWAPARFPLRDIKNRSLTSTPQSRSGEGGPSGMSQHSGSVLAPPVAPVHVVVDRTICPMPPGQTDQHMASLEDISVAAAPSPSLWDDSHDRMDMYFKTKGLEHPPVARKPLANSSNAGNNRQVPKLVPLGGQGSAFSRVGNVRVRDLSAQSAPAATGWAAGLWKNQTAANDPYDFETEVRSENRYPFGVVRSGVVRSGVVCSEVLRSGVVSQGRVVVSRSRPHRSSDFTPAGARRHRGTVQSSESALSRTKKIPRGDLSTAPSPTMKELPQAWAVAWNEGAELEFTGRNR